MVTVNTVIVGGGPAGIAVAASLGRRGVGAIVLEKGDTVAPAWHRHYESLHLHTNKQASGLPGRPMPSHYPRYPSRDEVASYMESYARDEGVDVRFDSEVVSCRREGGRWQVTTSDGSVFEGDNVVIATGLSHHPVMPEYPDLGAYQGEILHSSEYRNGEPFAGWKVLVVGFGNSGAEIALDLMQHRALTCLSVRSPSVVVPRDLFGLPILTIARWLSVLPPRLADQLSKPILLAVVGNTDRHGIPSASWGPMEQIVEKRKIPVLDVGTMAAIKRGDIKVRPGIERFTTTGVVFVDGRSESFDAVVFSTGFDPGLDRILESTEGLVDDEGVPLVSGEPTVEPGLYFCGFNEPPTGRLREIGLEAERIAEVISADVGSAPARP